MDVNKVVWRIENKHGETIEDRRLQFSKFFYGKACVVYQFAKQAGAKFTILRYG
jgi:hypothetical protein